MTRKIDKESIAGLTPEKKEILKSLMGSVQSPLDMNKMRDEMKEDENKKGITNGEFDKFLEMNRDKINKITPKNPVVQKDDEWNNEEYDFF